MCVYILILKKNYLAKTLPKTTCQTKLTLIKKYHSKSRPRGNDFGGVFGQRAWVIRAHLQRDPPGSLKTCMLDVLIRHLGRSTQDLSKHQIPPSEYLMLLHMWEGGVLGGRPDSFWHRVRTGNSKAGGQISKH